MSDTGSTTGYQPLDQKPKYTRICGGCPCDILPGLMLLCIMCLTFGSYWVFDTPGAIQNQLTAWFGKDSNGTDIYTNSMNLNLYAVYSWPNTVLAFFGGYIVDRITGVRLGAVLFCSLILIGQVVFCLGIQYKIYLVCLAGRFIFGLGGESLTVAQNTYTIRWFSGPTLALAFGAVLAFARIGSSVNFVVTPILADEGVPISVWFGAGTCGLSMLACLAAAFLDWYGADRHAKAKGADGKEKEEETVSFGQIKLFPLASWLLMIICLFFYICVLTFYTVASDIFQKTGNKYQANTATLFLAIPNFCSIIMSPTFGRVVDKVGRALTLILVASFMMVIAHSALWILAMEYFLYSPIYVMIWLGFAYSLGASCLWPILSVVIAPHMQGTAYGCMTAVQNAGLALFPMVIGALQDSDGIKGTKQQYTIPIFIFIGCAGVSILLTLILIGVDKRDNNGRMNASGAQREAMKQAEKEKKEAAEKAKLLAMPASASSDSLPTSPTGESHGLLINQTRRSEDH